jgi:hypothetical protein
VQGEETDEEPGAHFSDEHLEGLDDGLLEELVFPRVRVVAISDADIVLGRLADDPAEGGIEAMDLVFGEEGVADTGQQHQRHQDRDHGFGSHGDG